MRVGDPRLPGIFSVLVFVALLVPGSVARVSAQNVRPAAGVNPVLHPGDVVRLRVYREPDLSADYRVDEHGLAVFPKIGPLPVAELTTDSVKALILSNYAQYLKDPAVDVTFLRRVNVLGEVKSPNVYFVDPTMTLADLLAMAGGVTSDGNPGKIELLRDGHRLSAQVNMQSILSDSPLRSGDQVRVPRRSWLSRNAAIVAAGITGTAVVIATLIRN